MQIAVAVGVLVLGLSAPSASLRLTRWATLALSIAAGLLVVNSSVAFAETLTVTRNDDPLPTQCEPGNCSLREAVNAANNDGGATIMLQAAGTYQLTQRYGGGTPTPNGGPLLILHNTEIDSTGPARAVIVDDGFDRVFDVLGGDLTLHRITIQNGGGCCVFRYNGTDASGGGAIALAQGVLYAYDSLFADNGTGGFYNGGAIANFAGHVFLERVVLSKNYAAAGYGGGVYTGFHGLTDLYDDTFDENTALSGGALATVSSDQDDVGINVNVIRSTLQYNQAVHPTEMNKPQLGGAVYIAGTPGYNSANYAFADVTIDRNSAFAGGGIAASDASVELLNATVTRNVAQYSNGGIMPRAGKTSVTLANTIVAQNQAPSYVDCQDTGSGDLRSRGYNLVGDATGCFSDFNASGATGDQLGTTASPIDAKLGPLQNNGGQVSTDALLTGSPAINAGDPAGSCQPVDARGFLRSGGGRCDIGAYELAATPVAQPFIKPAITVDVAPTQVRVGKRVRVRITLSSGDPSCILSATVSLAGRHVHTHGNGHATFLLVFRRPGGRTVIASKRGCATGRSALPVLPRRS